MLPEAQTLFYDIRHAIEEIEGFFEGKPKRFEEFQKDIKTRRAVERNLEIIGEAMNRLLNLDSALPISNARKIVDTRNRITHGYDRVSEDILWSIVINHLPKLKTEIDLIMQEG